MGEIALTSSRPGLLPVCGISFDSRTVMIPLSQSAHNAPMKAPCKGGHVLEVLGILRYYSVEYTISFHTMKNFRVVRNPCDWSKHLFTVKT
jgi:hypothetical protein